MALKRLKKNLKSIKKYKHGLCNSPDFGQATIEFVLLLPLLVMIVLTLVQLGYCTYIKNVLEHAVCEAARVVATTNSENLARRQAYGICNGLSAENLDISISPTPGSKRITGDFFSVNISYKNAGIFNFISKVLKKDILIESFSVMRMECKG